MKKIFLTALSLMLVVNFLSAQQKYIDSLKLELSKAKEDTNKVKTLMVLAYFYQWSYPDSAMLYVTPGLQLAKKLNYERGQLNLMAEAVEALGKRGNYPQALQFGFQILKLAEKENDHQLFAWAWEHIGTSYYYSGDYKNALIYFNKLKSEATYLKQPPDFCYGFLGETYFNLNNLDSALFYSRKSYLFMLKEKITWPIPYFYLGKIYAKRGEPRLAISFLRIGIKYSQAKDDAANGYVDLATIYKNTCNADSAIFYARKGLNVGLKSSLPVPVIDAGKLLADLYKSRHLSDSALKYQDIMLTAKDSAFSKEKITQVQNFAFDEQMRRQEILSKQEEYRNNVKMYVLLAVVAVFILIAVLLWRNNRREQIANAKINKTLAELKATQAQLIQSEKMASLGELTAGIAHEIQNPLNFVNNFSEVNREMLEELKAESKKPKAERDEQLEMELISDLIENERKINHHGKRADSIVKGMLEHSRAATGEKQATDLNILADEFFKLSYHGLRAKDKSFNAEMLTRFDPDLPKMSIVQQDMGRVLLNLFNNAFYAVNQKSKVAGADYKPEVTVSTCKDDGQVTIRVKDNGDGIPDAIKDKIMQPFFTTKPTGEGTGLGLSLSYDIVVKGHGGKIDVETKENEFTEFIVSLPIN